MAGAPPPLPLPPDFLDRMVDKTGKIARFTLPGGIAASGTVELVQRDAAGNLSLVQGRLSTPSAGFFFFNKEAQSGVAGAFSGNARLDDGSMAYRAEPVGPGGASMLVPRRVDQVICLGMPVKKSGKNEPIVNAPQTYPTNAPAPAYNNNVVSLQTLPGARAVIYLDFNGGPGPWVGWGNFVAQPSGASNAEIRDVWERVAEDYQGFNVNITTDVLVFNAAPANSRQHVMITPTNTAAPGAGGVAYLTSFNSSADEVCWAFYTTGKGGAEVTSHEIGHTVGLSHMGQNLPNGTHVEYYEGQGSGNVGWAPIMGASYYDPLSQFSKGDYAFPSNTEDQLAIIANNNNNLGYRADDAAATYAAAKYLEILENNTVSNEGILERTGDVDAYRFSVTASSAVSINVNPVNVSPNLDILASIYKSDDASLVVSSNPANALPATLTATLPPGDYTVRVTGTGNGSPTATGYSNYGVVGAYLMSGSVPNGVKPQRFSVVENSPNATAVGAVTPRNNHGSSALNYSISGGNNGAAFAVNSSTGAITVIDRTKLNYETLSTRWDVPAVIPLFVTITDAANPALNETIRVLVSVTNENESPTISGGGSSTMLARTPVGTNLLAVSASDPDQLDYPTFTLVGGNSGGVFAIDALGRISVASIVNPATTTVYNLTVRASDQGAPPLRADTTVSITVLPLAAGYVPGTIAHAYYDNLTGGSVSDLTGSANFPFNATSEVFLPSASDEEHGDDYGSVLRGFVLPPATGNYTFWIASDDSGELRISPNASQASAVVLASNANYTDPNVYNAFPSQQATDVTLTAGQPYYIEARHKEGNGGDHVSIAWRGPGIAQQVIPGRFLAPFRQNYVPSIPAAALTLRRDAYRGSAVGAFPVNDLNPQDQHNAFAITGGTGAGLFSIDPATGLVRVNASPGALAGASSYTLNVSVSDTGTPVLSGSGTITINVIDATTISLGGIAQQIWTNMNGASVNDLTGDPRYPFSPTVTRTLTAFEGPSGYGSDYGTRTRALVTPPATGSYRFYIASDDSSRLLLNASGAGAGGAVQIASVSGYTDPGVYTAQAAQTSAAVTLTAGQSYYIEALQKQGNGGDFLQVAWTGPNIASPTIIPGSALKPYNLNAAPVYNNASYSFSLRPGSPNGTVAGTVAATDPEGSALTYALLSTSAPGAFTVNPANGVITAANVGAVPPGQRVTLVIGVQDDGLGGVYPLQTASTTVTINIPTPVEQWRQDNFGANAGNPAVAGNLADPDGDGVVNLLEYALATNPLVSNANATGFDRETIGGNTYLRLTMTKNPSATDVTYAVQVTGDPSAPASWSSAAAVVETNSATTLQVRDSVSMSGAAKRFIRLQVSVP